MADFLGTVIDPPRSCGHDGKPRKVGVEIEFAGLSAQQTAAIIRKRFGGHVTGVDEHRFNVEATCLGDFRSELDTRLAHPDDLLPKEAAPPEWLLGLTRIVSGSLGTISSLVVPCEVVAPPLAIDQLQELDGLIEHLTNAGAQGTDRSVFYAFGLHLNPEIATTDPAWLLNLVRAQILLSPWLRRTMKIDTSRYLTGFAQPYGRDYAELVLRSHYMPTASVMIDDYLTHNPSRDRELDLLPLFGWLDADRVRSRLPDEKISARPTFHYRLPNAALERPVWSIVLEWNRWCLIERLADDADALEFPRPWLPSPSH